MPSPRLDAELLIAEVLGLGRMDLYTEPDRELSAAERSRLRGLLRRRGGREPAQHILGRAGFHGLELRVDPRALVPRRETELLVDRALEVASGRRVRVLDLGAGGGAVALAMAASLQEGSEVVGVDSSPEALALAGENAERLGLADRVRLIEGDLYAALSDAEGGFDVIAANLPYIPTAEIVRLMPEVRDHDPRAALDGGTDGLELIRRAAEGAAGRLVPGGWILLEVGAGQAGDVTRILEGSRLEAAPPLRDPGGVERLAQARRPE